MTQQFGDDNDFFGTKAKNPNNSNLAVIGLCWDDSSTFRKGAAAAPDHIRKGTSQLLYNAYPETGVNLVDTYRTRDAGNLLLNGKAPEVARNTVYASTRDIYSASRRILFLGGDHLVTYFSFWSLWQMSGKKIGLIYLDAHPDLYADYNGDKFSHACVVQRIIDDTAIDPRDIFQIGIRAGTPEQKQFAEQAGINIVTTQQIVTYGIQTVVEVLQKHYQNRLDALYVSIDMDVLDPSFAPALGNPQPGGLSTRQVIDLLHGLQTLNVQYCDIVEICPKYDDPAMTTAFTAGKIIQEALGIMAKKK